MAVIIFSYNTYVSYEMNDRTNVYKPRVKNLCDHDLFDSTRREYNAISSRLAGHTRQGLKCRVCKMNVHLDCQEKVTTRCQVKSRLLRRQKSTSEIETKMAAMNMAGRDDDEGKLNTSRSFTFCIVPRE